MTIHHLIATYGYWIVFALVAAESLGVPLPGETALIAAATYAGATHKLSISFIFAVGAAAAIIGDSTGYWIGDKGGYRLVRRYGHYVRIDDKKMNAARYLFERHGGKVVFFGRFISVLRTYAAFLAGTTRMRYRRFLFFNAAGGLVWAALYSFGAYFAGSTITKASTPIEIAFVVIGVLVIVAAIIVSRRKMRDLTARAEEAAAGSAHGDASATRPAGDRVAGTQAPSEGAS